MADNLNPKQSKGIQVKCKYCGEKINKIQAFPHPTKPRSYYCNEDCYNNELQTNKGRKINSTAADGIVTCRCCGKRIAREKAFAVKKDIIIVQNKNMKVNIKAVKLIGKKHF